MAADEYRNGGNEDSSQRKNQRTKSGSEKDRIKNITNEVHPEYASSRKRAESGRSSQTARKPKTAQEREVHENHRQTEARSGSNGDKRTAAGRKRAAERRKRIRRRRRRQRIMRIFAACLVIAAFGLTVFVVRNYNSGSRHDNKGMNAYENSDYQTAIQEFKEALSYDSQNADYYIHLGMAYIEQKSYDEALGYFNQAEGCTENDNQTALLNRGRGIAYLYQGNYQASAQAFGTALAVEELETDLKADMLYYQAEAEEKSGDYAAAAASYGQIIQLNDDAGARMLRGMAYMELKDYASAETDLYAAVKKSRKSYSIYRALYGALEAQGKTDEANGVLNEALELSGSSGEDYFNRGMIYVDLQDDANAMDMLTQSYDKGYEAALLGMGEVAMGSGDYQTARGYYETFFNEADLGDLDTALAAKGCNQYAVCLMAAGDYEAAAEVCQNGLSYNNREVDASLSFNLIACYEYLTQWENAYNTAKSYAERYPEDERGMREYQFLESRVAP